MLLLTLRHRNDAVRAARKDVFVATEKIRRRVPGPDQLAAKAAVKDRICPLMPGSFRASCTGAGKFCGNHGGMPCCDEDSPLAGVPGGSMPEAYRYQQRFAVT